MSKFKCWYDYVGMETEGMRVTQDPVFIEAEDIAEAMWKWHHMKTPDWGKRFFNDSLDYYRSRGEFTGWGCWCKEVKDEKDE